MGGPSVAHFEFLCAFERGLQWVRLQGNGGLMGAGGSHVDPHGVDFPRVMRGLLLRARRDLQKEGVLRADFGDRERVSVWLIRPKSVYSVRCALSDGSHVQLGGRT